MTPRPLTVAVVLLRGATTSVAPASGAHDEAPRAPAAESAREHGDDEHADDEHADDEHAGDEHAGDEHAGDEHADHEEAFPIAVFERYGVRVATAGPGVVDAGIELPAEVRPNADRLAHVAPRFPGIVREVRKVVGDTVQAGEVLALVESERLATYELRAGFAGTVIDKHITPGEAVTRDEPAYIVADLSTVWVDISVHQKALPRVRVGQSVVVATSDGTLEAAGTVSYLTPIVDQATRTATARVVLPNPDGQWRPGLFVIATVAHPVEAVVVVPRRALHRVDDRAVVFVVAGDTFAAHPVTVGVVGRNRAQILSGLAAGERFADENSFLVKAELGKGSAAHSH
jgi:cobalt-zinc-cadmium efflux system membrane fusion protein